MTEMQNEKSCRRIFLRLCAAVILAVMMLPALPRQAFAAARYDTLQKLLEADLPAGTTATTKGYASATDQGGATFKIVDEATADNVFIYKMKNQKFAQMELTDTLDVAKVGIFPGEKISDQFSKLLQNGVKHKEIKTLSFKAGEYFINKPVELQSFNYQGVRGADGQPKTKFSVSKDYEVHSAMILYTRPVLGNTFAMNFSDITFSMELTKDHPLHDLQVVLLAPCGVTQCKIDHCNFISYQSETNGGFIMTDLLWFKHSANQNVEVSNCSFKNLSASTKDPQLKEELKDQNLVGGCLWMCGTAGTIDRRMENINIHDCEFETTVNDEIIAIWRGRYNNLTIKDCTFRNFDHYNNNILALYGGKFTNTLVKDCTVNLEAPSLYCFKANSMTESSEFTFDHIVFNCISGETNTDKKNVCLIYTGADSKEIDQSFGPIKGKVYIKNCVAQNKKSGNVDTGTKYRHFAGISGSSQKTYEITGCDLNMPFTGGVFLMKQGSDNRLSVSSNTIDNKDSNWLGNVENAKYSKLFVRNNEIAGKLSVVIKPNAQLFYNFSNNNCTGSEYGNLLQCQNLSGKGKNYIIYRNENNQYANPDKVNIYHNTNGKPKEDFVIAATGKEGSELDNRKKKEVVEEDTGVILLDQDQILAAKPEDYKPDDVLRWNKYWRSGRDAWDGTIPVSKLSDPVYCSMNLPSEIRKDTMDEQWWDNAHMIGDVYDLETQKILSIGAIYKRAGAELPEHFSVYLSNMKMFVYSISQKCWLMIDDQPYPAGIYSYTLPWKGSTATEIKTITYTDDYAKIDLTPEDLDNKVVHFWGRCSFLDKEDYLYYASAYTFWVDEEAAGKVGATGGIDSKVASGDRTVVQLYGTRVYRGETYPRAVWGHTIPNYKYDAFNGSKLNELYHFIGDEEAAAKDPSAGEGGSEVSDPVAGPGDTSTVTPGGGTPGDGGALDPTAAKQTGALQDEQCKTDQKITLPAPKLQKLSVNKKSRKVKVKWKKVSGVTGYQIQYCKNKKFKKDPTTIVIKGKNTRKKTLSSLGSGKKFYVRIRAYKEVRDTILYSKWSQKKAVKF
ncbi:MAG: hypothetical protein K5739_00205 [Lachnospiraceae bacterium]|nr:hypothetical protein [Lachnospiraceae bacterium]